MSKPETPLNATFEKPHYQDLQANLLAAMSKLFYYDIDDLDSIGFRRNFRDCQLMFNQLNERIEERD